MSNENDFVASLNRLERLIKTNQQDLKRDVESIITKSDRQFGLMMKEVANLKSSHSSLTKQLALLVKEDNQCNANDLRDSIRDISTLTSNNQKPALGASEIGVNVAAESVNLQCSVDGNSGHRPNEPAIDESNEAQTSKQSRKRKCSDIKSPVTESETLPEKSLPSSEMDTPGTSSSSPSKRTRVTSSSQSKAETTEQLNTGSVDSSDNPNAANEPSAEEEDDVDCEDELSLPEDDEQGGHYKIMTISLKCHECSAIVSKNGLPKHFQDKHGGILPFQCLANGCTERFEHWDGKAMTNHAQDKHSDISDWRCDCPKTRSGTFKTLNRLYYHRHHYHFEGVFKCGYEGCKHEPIANYRSVIRSHQHLDHSKTTKPELIYRCEYDDCGRYFNTNDKFREHQQIHPRNNPYRCDWNNCGKSFTQQNILNRHKVAVHESVKPYKCMWGECRYISAYSYDVIKHIRTQHFHLPVSKNIQFELFIKDDRDPREYLEKITTHQSDHNSTG